MQVGHELLGPTTYNKQHYITATLQTTHSTKEVLIQAAFQRTSAVSQVGLGSENSVGDTGIAAADWHAGLVNS
jgi:hypothetical protein